MTFNLSDFICAIVIAATLGFVLGTLVARRLLDAAEQKTNEAIRIIEDAVKLKSETQQILKRSEDQLLEARTINDRAITLNSETKEMIGRHRASFTQ